MMSFGPDRGRLSRRTADIDRPAVFDTFDPTGPLTEIPETGRATRHIGLRFSSVASGYEAPHRPGAEAPRHRPQGATRLPTKTVKPTSPSTGQTAAAQRGLKDKIAWLAIDDLKPF